MSDDAPPKLHPIQLERVSVLEAEFKAYRTVGEDETPFESGEGQTRLAFGFTKYDTESKTIGIKATAEMGKKIKDADTDEMPDSPFHLKISVIASFEVNEDAFDIQHIDSWARSNAGLLVYPYLREHVHGLTIRFGFPAVLLPLLQIPTFKNPSPSDASKSDES